MRKALVVSFRRSGGARFTSVLAAMLLLSAALIAQTTVSTGSIVGAVTDPQGAAIGRANIELFLSKSKDQSAVKTVTPDNDGHFAIAGVGAGDYQLRISSTGFTPLFISITVGPKASIEGPLNLKLGVLGGACPGSKTAVQENVTN